MSAFPLQQVVLALRAANYIDASGRVLDAYGIYQAAMTKGVSGLELDAALDRAAGATDRWVREQRLAPLPAPTGPVPDAQIGPEYPLQQIILYLLAHGMIDSSGRVLDPMAIYEAAMEQGVSDAEIDIATASGPGTTATWVRAHSLPPLPVLRGTATTPVPVVPTIPVVSPTPIGTGVNPTNPIAVPITQPAVQPVVTQPTVTPYVPPQPVTTAPRVTQPGVQPVATQPSVQPVATPIRTLAPGEVVLETPGVTAPNAPPSALTLLALAAGAYFLFR